MPSTLQFMCILITAIIASPSNLLADTDFDLRPQGKISSKVDKQAYSDKCSAIREYPVITGLKEKAIERRLNQAFAKILTVGKKLTPSDCPSKDDFETYEYRNGYIIGQQKGDYLGILFTVYFPGGSGRIIRDCRIYDLRNGEEVILSKNLTQNAVPLLQKMFAASDPQSPPPSINDSKFSSFCLTSRGVEVLSSPYGHNYTTVTVGAKQWEQIFVDNLLTKQLR